MEGKPLHFDGSVHHILKKSDGLLEQDILELTEEARMNLNGNPFIWNLKTKSGGSYRIIFIRKINS